MPTNTAGTQARDLGVQAVHTIRKTVGYADLAGATDELIVGYLPANAVVVRCSAVVTEGFNDTTADDLDVGFSAGAAELGAIDVNTAGVIAGTVAGATAKASVDRTIYVAPTAAATADGTAGSAEVVVEYVMPG